MIKRNYVLGSALSAALLVAAGAAAAAGPAGGATALSPAQQKVVAKKTAKMSKAENEIIAGWSDGKKLGEFFCAPAALAKFKREVKGADRVALGPDDEGVKQFMLDGNRKLSGRGTVRTPGNWKNFTFECVLDPETAAVTSFTYEFEAN